MTRPRIFRATKAVIVSFAALFVALGGVGYAAIHLPPNSVGSAQLQNGSVGNFKLKPGSVGPRKIINAENRTPTVLIVKTSPMIAGTA